MTPHPKFMRRALQLALGGRGHVSPNPMVGAVIVGADGRTIIGEGYHRRFGDPHAEVNAVRSVADPALLKDSTIYVTLEPCSHYGKTPPCAKLIIDSQIPRVVVGALDPNPKVSGRGIAMLREAGVEVATGILEDDCRAINAPFITAHSLRRPFITLKWAQSEDGFIDNRPCPDIPASAPPYRFSTPLGSILVHRLRSLHDGILVGSGTVLTDNPRLDCRLWPAAVKNPQPIVLDRRGRMAARAHSLALKNPLTIGPYSTLGSLLSELYSTHGLTSILIEGGARVLQSFIDEGLWDLARIEISPDRLAGTGGAEAPEYPSAPMLESFSIGKNRVMLYSHNPLLRVKYL